MVRNVVTVPTTGFNPRILELVFSLQSEHDCSPSKDAHCSALEEIEQQIMTFEEGLKKRDPNSTTYVSMSRNIKELKKSLEHRKELHKLFAQKLNMVMRVQQPDAILTESIPSKISYALYPSHISISVTQGKGKPTQVYNFLTKAYAEEIVQPRWMTA